MDFSGLKRVKGCRVYRLDLWNVSTAVEELHEIPVLKIASLCRDSLPKSLGHPQNKIIILQEKYAELLHPDLLLLKTYSKSFYADGFSKKLMLRRIGEP
jgi:hypothetical protein